MGRSLKKCALVLSGALLAGCFTASAEDLQLTDGTRWLVVASYMDADAAIGTAREYGADARVVKSQNGWLAVVIGPTRDTVEAARQKYWIGLPSDALLSAGASYVETIWKPTSVVLAEKEVKSGQEVRVSVGDVVTRFTRIPGSEGWTASLVGTRNGREVFALESRMDDAADYASTLYVVELDPANEQPEIVFDSFSGGAHCCTTSRVAVANRRGTWSIVDVGTRDGGGIWFEDVDGDGVSEILGVDQSFLYNFDSYAGSVSPLRIYRLRSGRLEDATADPVYRPRLIQEARGLEFRAELHPDLWGQNGFLAGWLASKMLIGEGAAAWAKVEAMNPAENGFGVQRCSSGLPLAQCPAASLITLPFLEGLRIHLEENGYGSPPVAGPGDAWSSGQGAGIEEAKQVFDRLPLQRRHELQTLLTANGFWPNVVSDNLGPKLFAAIVAFQESRDMRRDGTPDEELFLALADGAAPWLRKWGFSPVTHPKAGVQLWLPFGLGLEREREDFGLSFKTRTGSFYAQFAYLNGGLDDAYRIVLQAFDEHVIDYKVKKSTFFVITSHVGQLTQYTRFSSWRGGVVGFTALWDTEAGIQGDRVSTIMSDLFRSEVELGVRRSPPSPAIEDPQVTSVLPAAPDHPPASPAGPGPGESSGTGFLIDPKRALTNAHVVEGCEQVTAGLGGSTTPAKVIARDAGNDLALLELEQPGPSVAKLRPGVRLGEDVRVFGFPLRGLLASSGNFTSGSITATAGLADDSRHLQISAPVQPGNSGGPLIDESGNVVGVVVSKIDTLKLAAVTDDVAQNVNFAIKATIAMSFLETNGIRYEVGQPGDRLEGPELAETARSYSVAIVCTPDRR